MFEVFIHGYGAPRDNAFSEVFLSYSEIGVSELALWCRKSVAIEGRLGGEGKNIFKLLGLKTNLLFI